MCIVEKEIKNQCTKFGREMYNGITPKYMAGISFLV